MARTAPVVSARFASSGDLPEGADRGERRRRLIHQAHGEGARIRLLSEDATLGGAVFVVDFDNGPRHHRLLGAFRPLSAVPSAASTELVELSAMDLIYPARLVGDYERRMSVAFALCERPLTALLLGVGGAAMWRFIRAHLPECTATLVDSNENIVAIARHWFYLTQSVEVDTAERFLARATEPFDVILVDLYGADGPTQLAPSFWAHCLDALRPGGCLATNWADLGTGRVQGMAEAQMMAARTRGRDCFFVSRRGVRDNIVQFLPNAAGRGPEAIAAALARFAGERELPDGDRGALEDCVISTAFPADG